MSQTFHRILRHAALLGVSIAMSAGLVACGGGSSSPTLTSLSVSPATQTITPSGTVNLTVTGTYSNGSTQNVTSTASYASSNTSVATVSAAGVVTGVASGTSTITATLSGKSGTMTVTVAPTLSSIKVTAASAPLIVGNAGQLSVIGTFSDGSTADLTARSTYASSAASVATVGASTGALQGVAAGTTSIAVTATDPVTKTTATGSVKVFVNQLSACCQGAGAFQLFASDFKVYAAQDANGAYAHSIQGGDVFAGASSAFTYANYSSPASTNNILYTGYYQIGWTVAGALKASDYAYLTLLAPTYQYSEATGGATLAGVTPIDISQATTLTIRMGNFLFGGANNGTANNFTVSITNSAQTTTCSQDVAVTNSLATYQLPLSGFACGTGTLADLITSGVSQVAVNINGSSNPQVTAAETDAIAVQYVGFDQLATQGKPASGTLASGYGLFASDYANFTAANGATFLYNCCWVDSTGAFLHSAQGGDVSAFYGATEGYGYYSGINFDFYTLQVTATGVPDYAGITVTAPAGPQPTPGTAGVAIPVDITLANNMVIRMGNTFSSSPGGHAGVFTVEMADAGTANACDANVTLQTIGSNASTTPNSYTGLLDYVVPFSTFTSCRVGSFAALQQNGVAQVSVKIVGAQNPNIVVGDFDQISVGYIGFAR